MLKLRVHHNEMFLAPARVEELPGKSGK